MTPNIKALRTVGKYTDDLSFIEVVVRCKRCKKDFASKFTQKKAGIHAEYFLQDIARAYAMRTCHEDCDSCRGIYPPNRSQKLAWNKQV